MFIEQQFWFSDVSNLGAPYFEVSVSRASFPATNASLETSWRVECIAPIGKPDVVRVPRGSKHLHRLLEREQSIDANANYDLPQAASHDSFMPPPLFFVGIDQKVLTSFEKTTTGELVMDVELLEAFDDEADQGYYEDAAVTPEQLQDLIQETGEFAGGMPLEKFKGQIASPMEDTSSLKKSDGGLPGQLGKDVLGG